MQEAITCRCWFYRADETGACWAKCPKKVASCVVCAFGGRQFKPAGKLKKYRNKVK